MVKKTSKKHILKNLTIKNFRCFENFHLKDLKRINIFVGDNNSGKSSVLEAVGFLSPDLEDYLKILKSRGKSGVQYHGFPYPLYMNKLFPDLNSLFYKKTSSEVININAEFKNDMEEKSSFLVDLKMNITNKIDNFVEENFIREEIHNEIKNNNIKSKTFIANYQFNNEEDIHKIGFSSFGTYDLAIKNFHEYQVIFLSDETPTIRETIEKWSKLKELANLKESNDIDEKYLKIVQNFEKDLKKIELVNEGLIFRKPDFNIDLSDMGNGFKKFFDIILTIDLASKRDVPTLLCIDEIDNGLYYDKQDVFWEQLLKLCEEKNIQLFATTHSYDALKSIVRVFENRYKTDEKIDEELAVFRLVKVKNEVRARPFYFSLLKVMVESSTEIR